MQLVFSEYPSNYEQYQFPYQVWAIESSFSERDELLRQGFIPSRARVGLWYLARSMRINLKDFQISSENRRVIKNTSDFTYQIKQTGDWRLPPAELAWVIDFAEQKTGGAFAVSSIKRVFEQRLSTVVFVWRDSSGKTVGYVPVMQTDRAVFYWLAFYKPELFKSGLGSRMMLEVLDWAQGDGKAFGYLGTVYSNSSLYKTNFSGWEFFNGWQWSSDKELLKYLIGRKQVAEQIELLKDEEFVARFNQGKNLTRFVGQILK